MAKRGRAPIFCERICPVCRRARAGDPKMMERQRKALEKTGPDGCVFGRARTRYYGVTPDKNIPEDFWKD